MHQHIHHMTGSHTDGQTDISGKQRGLNLEVLSIIHPDKFCISITVAFVKTRSEHWSCVDKVDVTITEFNLTLIAASNPDVILCCLGRLELGEEGGGVSRKMCGVIYFFTVALPRLHRGNMAPPKYGTPGWDMGRF